MLRATLESKRAVQGGVYRISVKRGGGGGYTGSSPGLALGIMYESLVQDIKLILEFLNICSRWWDCIRILRERTFSLGLWQ